MKLNALLRDADVESLTDVVTVLEKLGEFFFFLNFFMIIFFHVLFAFFLNIFY